MCSQTSSPRFSFSNDVSPMKHDVVSCRDTLLLESNTDFEFITSKNIEFGTSSADELFSNGVILPLQIHDKKNNTASYKEQPRYMNLPPRPFSTKTKKEINKEVQETNTRSSSFIGFKKSKSLNCDTNKNFVCFSPPLSRSNSTGSAPNLKRTSSNRQQSSLSSSCSTLNNLYPVQKSCSGKSYGNGLRFSPVLNVPTPCFSKGSLSLFGFGSFLRVGKAKKNSN
ncbi:hypothetical protein MtrunA17_Chr8g0391091 [Medicago truncatula]|uniref:Uncharacterized protein n=1 Tax=Medicago truncatula TaxID=3880 RepID=G7L9Q4_MEDTR|nr:uncharacterized protein LOC11410129 [Medicago truncatula]AET05337.1 hypothetical protein MTR_8g104290 [Medicago truncatula]RHN43734.1 hypothetical protein MtrunA17_Chr8g0391091 [Medicago truncatula]